MVVVLQFLALVTIWAIASMLLTILTRKTTGTYWTLMSFLLIPYVSGLLKVIDQHSTKALIEASLVVLLIYLLIGQGVYLFIQTLFKRL